MGHFDSARALLTDVIRLDAARRKLALLEGVRIDAGQGTVRCRQQSGGKDREAQEQGAQASSVAMKESPDPYVARSRPGGRPTGRFACRQTGRATVGLIRPDV